MGHPIDLGYVEVRLSEGYTEARKAACIARVRKWEKDNRDRYLAGRRARYRDKHERVCKGSENEACDLLVTGSGCQRCNRHAALRAQEMRQARRDWKAAS